MVIYLIGPDSYRREKKRRELTAEYRKKNPQADFFEADFGESGDWGMAQDFFNQPSLFPAKKFAVLKGALTGMDRAGARLVRRLLNTSEAFAVLVDEARPRGSFARLSDKPALVQEFPILAGEELVSFVAREGRERGVELTKEGLRLLVSFLENTKEDRSWLCVNLLEMVALAGLPKPTGGADLAGVLNLENPPEIFAATRGIFCEPTAPGRLVRLEALLLSGSAPSHVFNVAGVVAKTEKDVLRLAGYDEQIKSGGSDIELSLLDFVLC